jgi:ubiquinone/menaquinone biosynthesis C-methylase UbiE
MWKWWYQKLAKANDESDFRFMNYGFEDDNGPELDSDDEPNRMFIQLYSMNIRGVDIGGKQVLEVGSGRGGGASWIAKTHTPAKLTGVDFSAEAVGHCKRWYSTQTNLQFIEGNAQDLPFENESFDVVYNVESSHCYGDRGAFVEQAYRVLKPGGMFCWTDLRDAKTMASLPALFESKGFEIVQSADVVEEVIRALDEINETKMKAIEEKVPKSVRRSFETFAGVKGTPVYEGFVSGSMAYHRHLMRKP